MSGLQERSFRIFLYTLKIFPRVGINNIIISMVAMMDVVRANAPHIKPLNSVVILIPPFNFVILLIRNPPFRLYTGRDAVYKYQDV
jgi:hypothetical protein